MAAVTIPIAFSSPSPQRRRPRCFSRQPQNRAPRPLQLAVSAVTEILRFFSSSNKQRDVKMSEVEDKVVVPACVDDVVSILRSDYQRAYFLTGNFTVSIYTEDCLFEDPTIKFRGRDLYSRNLDLLVPFLEHPFLKLEKIEKGLDHERNFILAAWLLRTYLKLPWRPLIAISGTTTYDLDANFQIVKHSESWNISALEAVGQILQPSYPEDK